MDLIWLEILIAMIGEQFGEEMEQICGLVCNVRNKGSKVGKRKEILAMIKKSVFFPTIKNIENLVVDKETSVFLTEGNRKQTPQNSTRKKIAHRFEREKDDAKCLFLF